MKFLWLLQWALALALLGRWARADVDVDVASDAPSVEAPVEQGPVHEAEHQVHASEEEEQVHTQAEEQAEEFLRRSSRHTNNWAVLVCTSRFWFNYRHMANTLSMYRTVKRLGIPDSQIILMLADDVSCNPRNAFPATVFNNQERMLDLYGDNIEVDYRGYEVTVENFIRLMTDRWEPDTPRSKRLLTDDRSNILFYMTGHGGNEFLKFQDAEEISAFDIAHAFEQMWEKRRYNEVLFMIDTCQANTMYSRFYSPNILAIGSSAINENSYSHHGDLDVGVAVIDRFTYYNLEFLEGIDKNSKTTMGDLISSYDPAEIMSEPGIRSDLFPDPLDQVLITDFFGNVQNVHLDEEEDGVLQNALLMKDNDRILSSVAGAPSAPVEKTVSPSGSSVTPPMTAADDSKPALFSIEGVAGAQVLRRPEVIVLVALVFFLVSTKLC